jgi:hypothetical protein
MDSKEEKLEKVNKKIKLWANKLDKAERENDYKKMNKAIEQIHYYESLSEELGWG